MFLKIFLAVFVSVFVSFFGTQIANADSFADSECSVNFKTTCDGYGYDSTGTWVYYSGTCQEDYCVTSSPPPTTCTASGTITCTSWTGTPPPTCGTNYTETGTGCTDSCGGAVSNQTRLATTDACPVVESDTTPPTISALSVSVSGLTVTVSWTASDNVGIDHYELWRSADGVNFSRINSSISSAASSITDVPGTGTWYYGFHAEDVAGKDESS